METQTKLTLQDLGVSLDFIGTSELQDGWIAWMKAKPICSDVVVANESVRTEIIESGSVPYLIVENKESKYVLLIEGMIFAGGLQTRTVIQTIVVGPKRKVRIPVRCVEAGRWSPRSFSDARRFRKRGRMNVRMLRSMKSNKARTYRVSHDYDVAQHVVWHEVDKELEMRGLEDRTRCFEAVLYQREELVTHREELMNAIRIPEEANGFFIRTPDGKFWIEVFPSHEDMLGSIDSFIQDFFDPYLERVELNGNESPEHTVHTIMSELFQRKVEPLPPLEGSEGQRYVIVGDDLCAEAVFLKDKLVYFAGSVVDQTDISRGDDLIW